jgi:hypothetical protein
MKTLWDDSINKAVRLKNEKARRHAVINNRFWYVPKWVYKVQEGMEYKGQRHEYKGQNIKVVA